jgi:hypothetical protein
MMNLPPLDVITCHGLQEDGWLVLGPAVKGRVAKLGVGPLLLPGNRVQGIPPAVVIVDRLGKRAVVVAFAMCRRQTRQPQADVSFPLRIAEAKSRDRKNQIGQSKYSRDLVDLIANDADRADTESGALRTQDHGLHRQRGIDAGIEKTFQRSVADWLSAQFPDALQPPCIAEKYEEHR